MEYTQTVNRVVMPTHVNLDRHRSRRVVFYGRVSTEHEAQLAALENQMQWYDDQAKYHPNWTVLNKYIDKGITGTQAKKRPSFLEMINDAKQKKFDLIVTREVCRFARNVVDTLVVTRELKEIGIEVYFVEDNIWTMDNDGELRLSLMATLAQEESRKTSERVRAGQKISRDNGVLYGNGNILGYERDNLRKTYVINPEQAETVKMIFDLYSKGLGLKKLCRELTELKRKDAHGNVSWSVSKLSRIIRNATYKGYKVYLKSYSNNYLDQKRIKNLDEETYLYVKGDFDPIVEEEIWEYCQKLRKKNSMHIRNDDGTMKKFGKKYSSDPYLNVMRCTCGSTFKKFRWHQRKDGTWSYGYQCYNQVNNGTKRSRVKLDLDTDGYCDTPMICDWKMDLMAYHIFNRIVDNRQVLLKALEIINRNYVEESAVSKELIAGIEAKIQHIKSRINILIEMRTDGEIDKNEFIEQKRRYDEQLEIFNADLSAAKTGSKIETIKDMDMQKIKDNLAELTNFKERVPSEIISKFVAQIFPTDNNHFDWFLNFDDKRHEQNFCTLEGKTNSSILNFKQDAQECIEHPTKFHSDYFLSANELGKNPMQRGLLQKSLFAEAKKTMKPVLTFTLNYEQARWFHHTFYHVMTRPNQWQDVYVNVYI